MGWTPSSHSQESTRRSGLTTSAGKQVVDLANAEGNQINQGHGWVARIQHAIQQLVPVVHEVREQWNLVAAYELYTGTLLKVHEPGVHAWRTGEGQAWDVGRGWTSTGWPT